jgi:hypothetical protein
LVEKRTWGAVISNCNTAQVEPHKKKGRSKGNRAWLSSNGTNIQRGRGNSENSFIHPGHKSNPEGPNARNRERIRRNRDTTWFGSIISNFGRRCVRQSESEGRKNFGERAPPPQSQKTQQQHKKKKKKRPTDSSSRVRVETEFGAQSLHPNSERRNSRLSANRLGNR